MSIDNKKVKLYYFTFKYDLLQTCLKRINYIWQTEYRKLWEQEYCKIAQVKHVILSIEWLFNLLKITIGSNLSNSINYLKPKYIIIDFCSIVFDMIQTNDLVLYIEFPGLI